MYPDISVFLSGFSTLKKIMVSHLPFNTFSSRSARNCKKGSFFMLGMVEARDFVLSFVRFSLASSIAFFLA